MLCDIVSTAASAAAGHRIAMQAHPNALIVDEARSPVIVFWAFFRPQLPMTAAIDLRPAASHPDRP